MIDDTKFWLILWALILAGFVTLVTSISAAHIGNSRLIAQMVKDGADPIRAACAIRGDGRDPLCILSVGK